MNATRLRTLLIFLIICPGIGATQTLEEGEYKFRRFELMPYLQSGNGYVVLNPKTNEGLLTINQEVGLIARYYFKRYDTVMKINRPRPISLYLKAGWGPLLTADKIIPNFWAFNYGITINQFYSSITCSLVSCINSSGEGSKYLYGTSISMDKVQVPLFFSGLWGSKDMKYLLLAGIRLPLLNVFPFLDSLKKRKKTEEK